MSAPNQSAADLIRLDFGAVPRDSVEGFQASILLRDKQMIMEKFLQDGDETAALLFKRSSVSDPLQYSPYISLDHGKLRFAIFDRGQLCDSMSATAALDVLNGVDVRRGGW